MPSIYYEGAVVATGFIVVASVFTDQQSGSNYIPLVDRFFVGNLYVPRYCSTWIQRDSILFSGNVSSDDILYSSIYYSLDICI